MDKDFTLKEMCRYPLGTFAEILHRNALYYADNEAFVAGSKRVTFAEFNGRVNRLVRGLKGLGCAKGDVIGVLSWNCLEYMEAWGAAMKGGFILAHLSPRLSEKELSTLMSHSEATVFLCGPEFGDMAGRFQQQIQGLNHWFVFGSQPSENLYENLLEGQAAEEIDIDLSPEDPLTIIYTSGTTGTPKGAVYNHRQKLDNSVGKALELSAQVGDRNLVLLPIFHIGGDNHIWPFFIMGGCSIIQEEPAFDSSKMLKIIQDEKVTDVQIVATQLIALLNYPDIDRYDLGSLKRIFYAASPMPVEVMKRGLKKFGPIFMQGYGMTESGPSSTLLSKEAHLDAAAQTEEHSVLASCGRACFGVQMRVVDDEGQDLPLGEIGEIIIHSSRNMSGYWRRPEETEKAVKNDWLYTGDMGYYDENAYIYIVDRKKDMIITGGENVYSKEVEDVLYQHPAVYEAAVIGAPDSYWVERVHAVVVLNDGAEASAEEMIHFCRERMARFKAPKSIEFLKELPKSPQGKILKRELRKTVSKTSKEE